MNTIEDLDKGELESKLEAWSEGLPGKGAI